MEFGHDESPPEIETQSTQVELTYEPLSEEQLAAMTPDELLVRLAIRAAQRHAIRAEMQLLATQCRDLGVVWRVIGDAAGLSAASAYKVWSPRGRQMAAELSRAHYRPTGEQ